jgi:hypothetical protein
LSAREATKKAPEVPVGVIFNAVRCGDDVRPGCEVIGLPYGSEKKLRVYFDPVYSKAGPSTVQGIWGGLTASAIVDSQTLETETHHDEWSDSIRGKDVDSKHVDPWLDVTIPPTILRSDRLHTRIPANVKLTIHYPVRDGEGYYNERDDFRLSFSVFVVSQSEAKVLGDIGEWTTLGGILWILTFLIFIVGVVIILIGMFADDMSLD